MCGIVGAVAERNVVPILMEGLSLQESLSRRMFPFTFRFSCTAFRESVPNPPQKLVEASRRKSGPPRSAWPEYPLPSRLIPA